LHRYAVFIIAIGVAIAAYGEINFIWIGVAEQLSALVFEAMRLMLVQVLITRQAGRCTSSIQLRSVHVRSNPRWFTSVRAHSLKSARFQTLERMK
jgi:hypothetical protein